jgi:hypothetical protein
MIAIFPTPDYESVVVSPQSLQQALMNELAKME